MATARDERELRRALTASLESAQEAGRLRQFSSLEELATVARAFIPASAWPRTLQASLHQPDIGFYGFAVVPAGPFLSEGDWHAGPVTVEGRDGVAVLLIMNHDVACSALPAPIRNSASARIAPLWCARSARWASPERA